MARRLTEEVAKRMTENQKGQVGYIPTENFVDVLVDVLTEHVGDKLYELLEQVIDKMEPSVEKSKFRQLLRQIRLSGTGLDELRSMINVLSDPETRRQMLVALNLVDAALDKLEASSSDMIPILLGVRQIKDKYLETALLAILNTAENLSEARQKIGDWFEGGMGRASEQYMKHLQLTSLIISFLLALLLNVDTLHMARILWEDPALRSSVAATAEATAPELMQNYQGTVNPDQTSGDLQGVQQSFEDAQNTLNTLLELRLPIGWAYIPAPAGDQQISLGNDRLGPRNLWDFSPANNPDGFLKLWVLKLVGLLLTTLALAQGAPFWFDLLRKLTGGGGSSSDT